MTTANQEEPDMNAIPYSSPQEEWEDETQRLSLPGRPRRRLWGPGTAILLSLLVGGTGFYVGIRVEKGQVGSSSGSGAGAASRAGGGGAFPRAGAFARGGDGSVGTVSSVSANAIYLTDFTGNTVKVKLSSATTITKSLGVSKRSVHPGDTIVVQGLKGPGATISATTVSDSGNRSAGTSRGSGSGGSGTSSRSAINSLFGG